MKLLICLLIGISLVGCGKYVDRNAVNPSIVAHAEAICGVNNGWENIWDIDVDINRYKFSVLCANGAKFFGQEVPK